MGERGEEQGERDGEEGEEREAEHGVRGEKGCGEASGGNEEGSVCGGRTAERVTHRVSRL